MASSRATRHGVRRKIGRARPACYGDPVKARLLLPLVWLTACAEPPAESSEPELTVPDAVVIDDYPASPDALFAEFAPMPGGPVTVEYAVTGPGGMSGTMTVTVAQGARRAERWALSMPMPGAQAVEIRGAAVQTPAESWTDAAEGSAELVSLPLGRVGEQFFSLDESTQHAIVEHVRTWHEEVARGRKSHPGSVDAVADRPCLRSQTAGQSLCVWEHTGLPLEYRTEAFTLVAVRVHENVEVDDSTFEIPGGGQRKADALQAFDVKESLEKLAAGDLAELPGLLQPRLRVTG